MKSKLAPSLIMLAISGLSQTAEAANWVDLTASEPANAPIFKAWGFIQPTYTHIDADPLSGMGGAAASSANGKYQIQNQVGPAFENTDRFQLMRA
ncbi:hypothetical protein [Thiobacillus sp.]